MIKNTICVYCRVKLNDIKNDEYCKSVEHFIPNSLMPNNRTNANGDFYVCRKCNSDKSMMDNLFGKISKFQSYDASLASKSIIKEFDKNKRNKKLTKIFENSTIGKYGIYTKMPFNGLELYLYMEYLGKGQFFKKTGKIYSKSKYIMIFTYINKESNIIFTEKYKKIHTSDNFKDLKENLYTEVVYNGECLIYAKEYYKYMFVFHKHTVVLVEVKKRNNRTSRMALKNKENVIKMFKK